MDTAEAPRRDGNRHSTVSLEILPRIRACWCHALGDTGNAVHFLSNLIDSREIGSWDH